MKIEMDTDQMQPSVWLDVLVATKVMGWKSVSILDSPYVINSGRDEYGKHAELPRYSLDAKAAWEVAETITGHVFVGYNPRIVIHHFNSGYFHVFFQVVNDDGTGENLSKSGGHLCEGVATTFPLAVCRCALKAVDRYEKFGYEHERYQGTKGSET